MWISDKLFLLNFYNQSCNGYDSKILIFETPYYTRGEHILQKIFHNFLIILFVDGEDWVIFVHFNQKNSDPLFWRENETGNGNGGADALFETLYKG